MLVGMGYQGGAIGIAKGDGLRGRYVHTDAEPTWTGKVLWDALKLSSFDVTLFEEFLFEGWGVDGIAELLDYRFMDPEMVPNEQGSALYVYDPEDGYGRLVIYPETELAWGYAVSFTGINVLVATPDGERWQSVAVCPFKDGEPDWAKIEALGNAALGGAVTPAAVTKVA